MILRRAFAGTHKAGLASLLTAAILAGAQAPPAAGPYQPTTQSLRKHKAPQWFEDAKFGIFIHWGPYAVPAFHEWYVEFISPKAQFGFMFGGPPYVAGRDNLPEELFRANIREEAFRYHLQNWGPNFAYDDFLPMFKAEKYDPQAWARLFQEAGARYVVLTAKHGDEFAMWPTKYTKRNAMEIGPRRDLAGELLKAVRGLGMKMGFYHNTTYTFWDMRYPGRDWVEYMNNSIKELVDLYRPDILWGDVKVGPVRDRNGNFLPADYWGSKEVLAYFYNHASNPEEVVANDRWGLDTDGKSLGDFATPERARMRNISWEKWETCDSLDPTSWGYNRRARTGDYMTANELVDYLADVVSKNGNLLINVGPTAEGVIPEVMQQALRGVGEWLRVNGEAIYGTRPWEVYRDGDVRFTRKGNTLYAIALEWPEQELRLSSLAGKPVLRVELLGSQEQVRWRSQPDALVIESPAQRPSKYAYAFRITCRAL